MSNSSNVCVSLQGSFEKIYIEMLDLLLHRGRLVSPRTQATREIRGVQLCIQDYGYNILYHSQRGLNYKFMVAEWLWIANGLQDVKSIGYFNKKYFDFSDDGVVLYGAYGPPWVSQKAYVLRKLRKDPDSRQAVITLWKPSPPDSKDVPCTLTMHYMIREGQLNVVVNMRSSDIYLGIPYDIFTFSQLANEIAFELNVERGQLIMQIGSSHVYERDVEKVRPLMYGGWGALKSPKIRYTMPRLALETILKHAEDFQGGRTFSNMEIPWETYEAIITSPRDLSFAMLVDLQQETNNAILKRL